MALVGKEPTCQCRRQETSVWSLGREDPLKDEMATHSSILAWRTPWTEEPGGLQSIGLHTGQTWLKQLGTADHKIWINKTFIMTSRRRKWQPTQVFLPGESHGTLGFWTLNYLGTPIFPLTTYYIQTKCIIIELLIGLMISFLYHKKPYWHLSDNSSKAWLSGTSYPTPALWHFSKQSDYLPIAL